MFKVGKNYVKPKDEWVVVKDIFEPIVDLELWERVQEVNGKRRRMCKAKREPSIFSGIAYCPDCGRLAGTSIDNLLPKYQREQEELKKQLSALQEQSAEHDATEQNVEKWISLIRQYSDLKELNSCIINELITKILVGDKRRS